MPSVDNAPIYQDRPKHFMKITIGSKCYFELSSEAIVGEDVPINASASVLYFHDFDGDPDLYAFINTFRKIFSKNPEVSRASLKEITRLRTLRVVQRNIKVTGLGETILASIAANLSNES